jgi:hypothetical protein
VSNEAIGKHIAELLEQMRQGQIQTWVLRHEPIWRIGPTDSEKVTLYVELPANHQRNGQDRYSLWDIGRQSGSITAADVEELLAEALADLAVGRSPNGKKGKKPQ